jgi:hypothetical protein
VGHGQHVHAPPLDGGSRDQPRSERLPLCRRDREVLHRRHSSLGGQNYVLWGGREGYETLLKPTCKREREQRGGSCHVVDYKHKIGFQARS